MDISQAIAEMKKEPGFAQGVGMILIHNGVVRAWSRGSGNPVAALEVTPDHELIEKICAEMSGREGIFKVVAKAESGRFVPGDDLLFIIVAGDVRENVKPVLAETLDRIKSEAVAKREIRAGE